MRINEVDLVVHIASLPLPGCSRHDGKAQFMPGSRNCIFSMSLAVFSILSFQIPVSRRLFL